MPTTSKAPSNVTRRVLVAGGATATLGLGKARAASALALTRDSRVALERLYAARPKTREWGAKAKAILVFPSIVKAGAVIGGQSGDGAAFVAGRVIGFYNISAASVGFQLGAQTFSYALFVMSQGALDYIRSAKGWAVGTGPSIVIVDEGFAKTMNTTTFTHDVYAVAFGQRGLMAGTGLEGSKISQIYPNA